MSDLKKHLENFDKLPQEAQAKISESLKGLIEKELTVGGAGSPQASFDKQHDRGPLFGKDFDKQSKELEELRQLADMDPEKFKVFSERLAAIKGINK